MKLTARLLLVAAILSLAFGPFASIPGALRAPTLL